MYVLFCELGDNYYYAAAGGYSASQRSQTFYCDVCKVDCVGSQVGPLRQVDDASVSTFDDVRLTCVTHTVHEEIVKHVQ